MREIFKRKYTTRGTFTSKNNKTATGPSWKVSTIEVLYNKDVVNLIKPNINTDTFPTIRNYSRIWRFGPEGVSRMKIKDEISRLLEDSILEHFRIITF